MRTKWEFGKTRKRSTNIIIIIIFGEIFPDLSVGPAFFSDPALCFTGNTTDEQTLLQSIARYTGAEHRYRAVIAVAKRKVISLSEANWNKRFNKMRCFVVQCDHVYAESSQNNKTLQVICRKSGHLLSQGDVILSVINTSDDTRMPAVTDHYRRSEWSNYTSCHPCYLK